MKKIILLILIFMFVLNIVNAQEAAKNVVTEDAVYTYDTEGHLLSVAFKDAVEDAAAEQLAGPSTEVESGKKIIFIPSRDRNRLGTQKGKAKQVPEEDVEIFKRYDEKGIVIENENLENYILSHPDSDYSRLLKFFESNKGNVKVENADQDFFLLTATKDDYRSTLTAVSEEGKTAITELTTVAQIVKHYPKFLWWEAKETKRTLEVKTTRDVLNDGTIVETVTRTINDDGIETKKTEIRKEFNSQGSLTRQVEDYGEYNVEKNYLRDEHLTGSKITFSPRTVSGEIGGRETRVTIKGVQVDSQGKTRVIFSDGSLGAEVEPEEIIVLLKDYPEIRKQVLLARADAPGVSDWTTWWNKARAKGVWEFLGGSLRAYEQYKGLSGFTNLIQDKSYLEWKKNWREKVSNAFCVFSGIGECFKSQICERYIRSSGQGTVIGYFKGSPRAVIKIIADKSLPIDTPEGTAYYYRISYYLANPTKQTMNYNIYFYTAEGRKIPWFIDKNGNDLPQQIQSGNQAGRSGSAPLISAPSTKDYSNICIEFNPRITKGADSKSKTGSHCTGPIAQYTGSIQNIQKQKTSVVETIKSTTGEMQPGGLI